MLYHNNPNYRYSFKEWQDWSFKQTDNKGFTRSSLTVLSGTEGKKQVDEPWFNLLLHETKFSGEKGLIGRNNVMFTLSLAYFSSGYSIETCEYNMFEFNNRLDQPLEEKEVIKLVRSAYSENYQGANREYITILCKAWVSSDLTSKDLFVRQGWFKFKKKRSERQRVHLSEWKEDLMAYISEKSDVYKPYLVTTKKEIREALGIPERTLDKLLKVLKANQEIFFKIKPGRNGGIQLASVKSLLLSIIKVKKEEKESYIKALSEFFDLEHTFIQETLNKLAEHAQKRTHNSICLAMIQAENMEEVLIDDNMVFDIDNLKGFLNDTSSFGFIAKENNKIIGFAYCYTLLRPDGKTMFYLHSIGMLPNYQDKGYGSKLLSFIKEYSKEIGCSEMFLITDKGNPRACHVYEKLGGKNDYKDEIVYVYDYEKGDK